MKGTIIEYSPQDQSGRILTDDQQELAFQSTTWHTNEVSPTQNAVNFELDATNDITTLEPCIEMPESLLIEQATMTFIPPSPSVLLLLNQEENFGAMDWFIKCAFRRYFSFSKRARRREFWNFIFVAILISFFTTATDAIFGVSSLTYTINALLIIPLIAVGARRLHDVGLSGWWQLLYLTGFGFALLVILWLRNSETQSNKYGESPKIHEHQPILL